MAKTGVREHTIGKDVFHHKWDNSIPPAVEIESGDIVHFETEEVTAGQLKKDDPASKLGALDFDRLYPLGGPVYVKGAEPGDAIEVEILSLKPGAWGWSAILPGLGLLASDFPDPYVRYFDLGDRTTAELRKDIQIPIAPFCGTMGVATDEPGKHDVLPPTKGAGNVDTRHLTAGTKLYLPVFVPGALFSAGDCHAAQGDGEVCVTGIECPMSFSLRFGVVKGGRLRPWSYHFLTPAKPLQPKSDAAGYHAVCALGPDLKENAKNSVRDTIAWLHADHKLSREDAYILCSLAGDLRISQIVDEPNFGVSFYMPLSVFS
jgi:acetamidase/formamidase